MRRYLCCGQLLSQLSLRRRLPNVTRLARPLLANNLSNILLEIAPLVAVLVQPLSSNGCHLKGLTKLPRKSDRSDTEVGERRQSHTLRFGKCGQCGKVYRAQFPFEIVFRNGVFRAHSSEYGMVNRNGNDNSICCLIAFRESRRLSANTYV